MTETTCPVCGAKCNKIEKEPKQTGHIYYEVRHKALPQPDLTKLREAYRGLENFANDPNLYGLSRYTAITAQTGVVLREVQRLLEQETI